MNESITLIRIATYSEEKLSELKIFNYIMAQIVLIKHLLTEMFSISSVKGVHSVPCELFRKFQTSFYADPDDATFKVLRLI